MEEKANTSPKRIILIVLAIVLAVVLAAFLYIVVITRQLFGGDPYSGEAFNSARWEERADCSGLSGLECSEIWQDCPRGPMVSSIVEDVVVPGTPLSRSRELLGTWDEGHPRENWAACDIYPLGFCSGIGIDMDFLYVCADDSGLVQDVRPRQH